MAKITLHSTSLEYCKQCKIVHVSKLPCPQCQQKQIKKLQVENERLKNQLKELSDAIVKVCFGIEQVLEGNE